MKAVNRIRAATTEKCFRRWKRESKTLFTFSLSRLRFKPSTHTKPVGNGNFNVIAFYTFISFEPLFQHRCRNNCISFAMHLAERFNFHC